MISGYNAHPRRRCQRFCNNKRMDVDALPIVQKTFATDGFAIQVLRGYVQELRRAFALELHTLEGISIAEISALSPGFDTVFGPRDRPGVSELAAGVNLECCAGTARKPHHPVKADDCPLRAQGSLGAEQ